MNAGRDYRKIAEAIAVEIHGRITLKRKLEIVTQVLWDSLRDKGLSWVGFYKITKDEKEMLLVCRQPKPACSPIGLHGVCGRAWKERRAQVVSDVQTLGGDHIVCDPANLSEVVIPVIEKDGQCRYVLDLDSRELDSFSEEDVIGLGMALKSADL